MMPLLRENRDLMVIRKKGAGVLRKYDAVLFIRSNGEYVLHRIYRVTDEGYWIVGDNCISGEMVREEQIIGILTEIVRDGKTIKNDRQSLSCICLSLGCVISNSFFLPSKCEEGSIILPQDYEIESLGVQNHNVYF